MAFTSVFTAAFFQDCISEQDLDEMNIEIIRNTLYKVSIAFKSLGAVDLEKKDFFTLQNS